MSENLKSFENFKEKKSQNSALCSSHATMFLIIIEFWIPEKHNFKCQNVRCFFFIAGNFKTLDSLMYSAQQNAMISPPTFPDKWQITR